MEEDSFRDWNIERTGGGVGGWFGINGQGILVEAEEEISYLKGEESLKTTQRVKVDLDDEWGKVQELNQTVLGSWKWQSEGVSEDLLFIRGWDVAGPHKIVKSSSHSQVERDLWGGRKVSFGNEWFGPRKLSRTIENMEKFQKEKLANPELISYWPRIQKSGEYLTQEDLDGIQSFWKNRDRELEEDIFGLYNGWAWWAETFGKKKNQERVDLEFDLSKIKQMLEQSENDLRDKRWSYGKIFQNPKLALVRAIGDVEATAFNYLKHVAWPDAGKVKNLKEKKIAIAILALIAGEEIGFDCEKGKPEHKNKYFKECLSSLGQGQKIKRVLKSSWKNSNAHWSPTKGRDNWWDFQEKLSPQDAKELVRMDDIKNTSLLDEKCEDPAGWLEYFTDGEKEIRREICDQIIRPWFGNTVTDKRLCLIEVEGFEHYFRLNTYLKVLEVPMWIHKNAFWTKCSNYGV